MHINDSLALMWLEQIFTALNEQRSIPLRKEIELGGKTFIHEGAPVRPSVMAIKLDRALGLLESGSYEPDDSEASRELKKRFLRDLLEAELLFMPEVAGNLPPGHVAYIGENGMIVFRSRTA